MRGRVKDLFSVRVKVRTSGPSIAVREHLHIRAIDVHRVDLIAAATVACRLKDELFAISRKIGFSVFAAKGQLPDVAQVFFRRQRELLWWLRTKQIGRASCRE